MDIIKGLILKRGNRSSYKQAEKTTKTSFGYQHFVSVSKEDKGVDPLSCALWNDKLFNIDSDKKSKGRGVLSEAWSAFKSVR